MDIRNDDKTAANDARLLAGRRIYKPQPKPSTGKYSQPSNRLV